MCVIKKCCHQSLRDCPRTPAFVSGHSLLPSEGVDGGNKFAEQLAAPRPVLREGWVGAVEDIEDCFCGKEEHQGLEE